MRANAYRYCLGSSAVTLLGRADRSYHADCHHSRSAEILGLFDMCATERETGQRSSKKGSTRRRRERKKFQQHNNLRSAERCRKSVQENCVDCGKRRDYRRRKMEKSENRNCGDQFKIISFKMSVSRQVASFSKGSLLVRRRWADISNFGPGKRLPVGGWKRSELLTFIRVRR